ncbi:hypothetical protein NLI96_g4216 [Meripilus lineatus]|uniref:Uncharacterized protein n=1 Tax=Meripilus lineatus TaxID=2056292 RepID=A0AAD5VAB1_9APHY|nr:hypothetical protein NLI96_g4216 [Physisporinus lineatus]
MCDEGFENDTVLEQHVALRHGQISSNVGEAGFPNNDELTLHQKEPHSRDPEGVKDNLIPTIEVTENVPEVPPGLGLVPPAQATSPPFLAPIPPPDDQPEDQEDASCRKDVPIVDRPGVACTATIQLPETLECPRCNCTLRLKLELVST